MDGYAQLLYIQEPPIGNRILKAVSASRLTNIVEL